MVIGICIFLILAVCVGAAFFIIKKKLEKKPALTKSLFDSLICRKTVSVLSATELVAFFKQPEIIERLKEDKDIIAIAIKEKKEDGEYSVVACLYSKSEEELVDPETLSCVFDSENLDEELEKLFGDKDMIVVQ